MMCKPRVQAEVASIIDQFEHANNIPVLDLVKLTPLMKITSGRPEIVVGLIDGHVAIGHPDLNSENISKVSGNPNAACDKIDGEACLHGTFVAGMLLAKRGSQAPAICPNCTLLVRPIFHDIRQENEKIPSSTPEELAVAIIETIDGGAQVINLSAALLPQSLKGERELKEALDYGARRSVIIVAAAGNQGTLGSTAITYHPWVIPVAACDQRGRPMSHSNLGSSIGRRGLSAPGDNIISLGADGKPIAVEGTSAATPFITGAIALLLSEFPKANTAEVKYAVTQDSMPRRNSVVPPLLDAYAAYQVLALRHGRR